MHVLYAECACASLSLSEMCGYRNDSLINLLPSFHDEHDIDRWNRRGKNCSLSSLHLSSPTTHTPRSLFFSFSLSLFFSYCLSILEPPAALTVRDESVFTRGKVWRQKNIIAGKEKQKKTHTHTRTCTGRKQKVDEGSSSRSTGCSETCRRRCAAHCSMSDSVL